MNESQKLFCEKIRKAAEEFLSGQVPPDYQTNAKQYLNINHVVLLYQSHLLINELIGSNGSILDIGSGINFHSQINPNIVTSNPREHGIGVTELYRFINNRLGVPVDISLLDINTHDRWIETEQQFNIVVAHRFLPWTHKPFTAEAYKRFLRECYRVLLPDGVVWYFTNHRNIFLERAGEEGYIWKEASHGFIKTTKQQLGEILK